MRVLAFDVAVSGCAVGVLDTEKGTWASDFMETDRGQAEMLIPMIEKQVHGVGWIMNSIDRIAVTQGPGSFTGVRIGLATARALGMALDIPVLGQSTLDLLRHGTSDPNTLILIDTKRGDYYGQVGEALPRIWSEEEVTCFQGTVIKDTRPDIRILAEMVVSAPIKADGGYHAVPAPYPIYLREAEVSQPKKISPYACSGSE